MDFGNTVAATEAFAVPSTLAERQPPALPVDVTVIVVSYNTCDLTLACLRTLLANAGDVALEVVVFDNASVDGSAEAIERAFPSVRLVRSAVNLGFARANNLAAREARGDHLLLLNPDTETHDRAVERLLAFARARPGAGIWGGRTLFPDGSLNPGSCLDRITVRSQLFRTVGLSTLLPGSRFFNPEEIGGWRRETVRDVDIVVGCFLLTTRRLWGELGGFDPRYFMYGEEADLCHRARALGYRPAITPEATIMHLAGASSATRADKILRVAQARATLMRDHLPPAAARAALLLLWLWGALRAAAAAIASPAGSRHRERAKMWSGIWRARREWLAGYRPG